MAATTDTSKYKLNHTMIRVKDPKESIAFYEFLGMKLIQKFEVPEAKFDLYFMAYDGPNAISHGKHFTDREGIIELTHNYGTENDPEFKVNNGNTAPHRGFGHICISVDNIQAACKRLQDAGYKFQKTLDQGSMRHIAFALDPSGYWVELIALNPLEETENITTTDVGTYRMNHTMIRVKDIEKSLKWYQEVLGMSLLRKSENAKGGFNLYFLGYPGEQGMFTEKNHADHEGLVELTWNYGTEKEADFKYHNGNDEPQGFGHLCISVDELTAACERFESLGCKWKKRLTDGRMKNIAFLLDEDGYWIEVVQNQALSDKYNVE